MKLTQRRIHEHLQMNQRYILISLLTISFVYWYFKNNVCRDSKLLELGYPNSKTLNNINWVIRYNKIHKRERAENGLKKKKQVIRAPNATFRREISIEKGLITSWNKRKISVVNVEGKNGVVGRFFTFVDHQEELLNDAKMQTIKPPILPILP